MEELLRQILEELRTDSTNDWLETLKVLAPLIGGLLAALVGAVAVLQANTTQRAAMKATAAAQAEFGRTERRTAWRQERYGLLLAALGEYLGALRSMNLALDSLTRTFASSGDDEAAKTSAISEFAAAAKNFREVNMGSRILNAAVQVADENVANLAQQIADKLYRASGRSVAVGASAQLPRDEQILNEEAAALMKLQEDTNALIYALNQRVEDLISEDK